MNIRNLCSVFTLLAGVLSYSQTLATPIFIANIIAASGTLHTSGPTTGSNMRTSTPTGFNSAFSMTDRPDQAASASAQSSAQAEVGAVHATSLAWADTYSTACCTSALGQASALAEWNDHFVAHISGVADGTVATISANVLIHGDALGVGQGGFWSGLTWWRSTVGVNGQGWVTSNDIHGNPNATWQSGSGSWGILSFMANIVLGQEMNAFLRVESTSEAGASGYGVNGSRFYSDLGHTVSWQGISSMTVGGMDYQDFTAVSADTSFDFVRGFASPDNSVPEPMTVLLILFGLVGIWQSRRKMPIRSRA